MITLLDFILDLFRSPGQAASFVMDPEGTMRDVGLPNVSAAQLASVAATAAPAGVALGGGDPVVGLQRAVADYHSLATPFSPQSSFASPLSPQTSFTSVPTFAPETNTDLASHNSIPVASPVQDAGANAQNGAFNLGFGDITLGDKTTETNTAANGGVIVKGDNDGDIVSGDGAVLGDGNTTNNGDVYAGSGSHVAVGEGNEIEDSSQHAGSDLITDNDAPVLNDVSTGGGNGGGAVGGGGGGGLLGSIGVGSGNASGGDAGNGGSIIISDSSTHAVGGDQTEIGGDSGSGNTQDNSVNTVVKTNTETSSEANTSTTDHSSHYESNIGSGNDTSLLSGNHTDTSLLSGNDTHPSLLSDNGLGLTSNADTDIASHDTAVTHTDLPGF
jgi:hypothetical protein